MCRTLFYIQNRIWSQKKKHPCCWNKKESSELIIKSVCPWISRLVGTVGEADELRLFCFYVELQRLDGMQITAAAARDREEIKRCGKYLRVCVFCWKSNGGIKAACVRFIQIFTSAILELNAPKHPAHSCVSRVVLKNNLDWKDILNFLHSCTTPCKNCPWTLNKTNQFFVPQ